MDSRDGSAQMPLKAVVYATDFSRWSQNAGWYASLLAEHFAGSLVVSHAFYLSVSAIEAEIEMPLESVQRTRLKASLKSVAENLGRGTVPTIPILAEGVPTREIPRIADLNAPSIIVLGTHGGGRMERGVVGSTAEGILRSSRWPSLTVGPKVPPLDLRAAAFRRILYATELNPHVAKAAGYAAAFAGSFNSPLDVLHVVRPQEVANPDCFRETTSKFYSTLDTVVPPQYRELCRTRSYVEAGSAHRQILQHIQDCSVDLLVLGLRWTSHIWTESRRSGAFQIIASAPCPVLTVTG